MYRLSCSSVRSADFSGVLLFRDCWIITLAYFASGYSYAQSAALRVATLISANAKRVTHNRGDSRDAVIASYRERSRKFVESRFSILEVALCAMRRSVVHAKRPFANESLFARSRLIRH
jgi:hypothetical protein